MHKVIIEIYRERDLLKGAEIIGTDKALNNTVEVRGKDLTETLVSAISATLNVAEGIDKLKLLTQLVKML